MRRKLFLLYISMRSKLNCIYFIFLWEANCIYFIFLWEANFFTLNFNQKQIVLTLYFYESKYRCKDQESIQSNTTPDSGFQWESDKFTVIMGKWQIHTTNESQEVSPFPAGDHKAHINRPAQRHSKHKTEKKTIRDPQKKYRHGTVSKISNRFNSSNLTLNSDVCFVFVLFLLLYVPCQQLWSLRDGQFT